MPPPRPPHTLRVIAAVLGAVLALAAAPGAALAAELHSEVEPTYLSGEQVVTNRFDTLGPFEANAKCLKATVRGVMTGTAEKEIALLPQYNECTYVGRATIWKQNECKYTFSFSGFSPSFFGGTTIQCPLGKSLELIVGTTSPPLCTIEVASQVPTGSVDYSNQGSAKSRDFLLTWTATGINYTVTYPGPPGTEECGSAGLHNTGKQTGTITVKGFKNMALTEQVGVWIE